MAPAILIPPAPECRRQPWHLKRTWLVGLPVGLAAFLLVIAPPLPEAPRVSAPLLSDGGALPFRYQPDRSAYALDFDPRRVRIDLFEGWDREQQAYADRAALAFVSGPMYERYPAANGGEITVPLGDLKFGERVWRGRNRTAARQRAYVAIGRDGGVEFGFGELTAERQRRFEIFIGGLHSLYNDLEPTPASYRGAYSLSMGQQIRYYLPRIRMVYGLRPDGRLEVLMSRDGLTLEQTRALARSRGLRAAYLPDHASKSRLIVPGSKGFSASDANWISGGASSFVHVPYMLRLSRRGTPLQGSLQMGQTVNRTTKACSQPFACGPTLAGQLLDRLLAGFNRWMEEGVEPVARLFWAPRLQDHQRQGQGQHAPLREAPISADPLVLQSRQRQEERRVSTAADQPAAPLELPKNDTLPAPELLPPLPPDAGPASLRSAPASATAANEAAPPEDLNAPSLEAPPAEGAAAAAVNAPLPPPPPANPPAANLPALQPPN